MSYTILLIAVFVIIQALLFAIAWKRVPDEQDLSDEEREAALWRFYHP